MIFFRNSAREHPATLSDEQIKKARAILPAVFGGAAFVFGVMIAFIVFPDERLGLQALIALGFGTVGTVGGFILSLADARARRKPPPPRVVEGYRPEELVKFREAFATVTESYARSLRRMLICFILAIGFFFAMYYSAGGLKEAFALAFGVSFIGALWSIKGLQRACPACGNVLDEGPFGQYCPECGSPKLEQPDLFRAPRCADCGRTMRRRRRGRDYKIRACTHCGVMLDEVGF
jgi:RNA polymerase subunit RPABC4/transcription elongation factor Spt4